MKEVFCDRCWGFYPPSHQCPVAPPKRRRITGRNIASLGMWVNPLCWPAVIIDWRWSGGGSLWRYFKNCWEMGQS